MQITIQGSQQEMTYSQVEGPGSQQEMTYSQVEGLLPAVPIILLWINALLCIRY